MGGSRKPSGHALMLATNKGKRPPQAPRDKGGKKRRQPEPDSDSDSDGEPKKKKKKKKKKDAEPEPAKLRLLPPRLWDGVKLQPIVRAVREADAGPAVSEADVEAMRKQLRLRVPTQRRKACQFWLKGECKRGSACAFLHATAEQAAALSSSPATCPPPVLSLGDPTLPKVIGRAMIQLGYRTPSPIQAQAWPAALAGFDLLCRAPTGSGKTLGARTTKHTNQRINLPSSSLGMADQLTYWLASDD